MRRSRDCASGGWRGGGREGRDVIVWKPDEARLMPHSESLSAARVVLLASYGTTTGEIFLFRILSDNHFVQKGKRLTSAVSTVLCFKLWPLIQKKTCPSCTRLSRPSIHDLGLTWNPCRLIRLYLNFSFVATWVDRLERLDWTFPPYLLKIVLPVFLGITKHIKRQKVCVLSLKVHIISELNCNLAFSQVKH